MAFLWPSGHSTDSYRFGPGRTCPACLSPAGPKEQWEQVDFRQRHSPTLNLTSSHQQPSLPPALPRTLTLQPQVLEEGQALRMDTRLTRSVPM